MTPVTFRLTLRLSGLALAVAALLPGCSPRTISKPPAADSGLRAPLPTANAFAAGMPRQGTPFHAGYGKSTIPWQPWSQESLAQATASNRPLLLNVGYSTCPFSRRLRTQAMEDPALAAYLGGNFLCVLVDADDSSALANLLLDYQPILGCTPSYPMLVWVLPDGKPYLAHSFTTRTGFTPATIQATAAKALKIWQSADGYAALLANDALARLNSVEKAGKQRAALGPEALLDQAYTVLNRFYDASHGTVSSGQNFPGANILMMAMAIADTLPESDFRHQQLHQIAGNCLGSMRAGAIHDPLENTFHRYSEKPDWNGPHSEKTLADQAMIAIAYLDAARHLDPEAYRATAFGTLDSVLATWKAGNGLFRHAETAFTGAEWSSPPPFLAPWFTWSLADINALLSPAEAKVLIHHHGMMQRGNMPPSLYRSDFKDHANVLGTAATPAMTATALGMPVAEVAAAITSAHAKLREARMARPGFFRDDRTTVVGNALLLSALAQAAAQPGGERFLAGARDLKATLCARFLVDNTMVRFSGHWDDQPLPTPPGLLEYALLLQALLDVHAVAPEPTDIIILNNLTGSIINQFGGDSSGIFRSHAPALLLPVDRMPFPFGDTAVPAANSVMAANLRRLHALTGSTDYLTRRDALVQAYLGQPNPAYTGYSLAREIAIDKKRSTKP